MLTNKPVLEPLPTPKTCPFCGNKAAFGLTKKTGCQLHGEPIQRVTLGCNNQICDAKPTITGGDRYRYGETCDDFAKGEREAKSEAIEKWNRRSPC